MAIIDGAVAAMKPAVLRGEIAKFGALAPQIAPNLGDRASPQ